MKLASLKGSRDGTLVVVSRDLERQIAVPHIAPTLQATMDNWHDCAPRLMRVYDLAFNQNNSYLFAVSGATTLQGNVSLAGNGRVVGKDKEYPRNWSPLHVWEFAPAIIGEPSRVSDRVMDSKRRRCVPPPAAAPRPSPE